MEDEACWEQNTLINELIQGMEVARKLRADLRTPYSADTRDLLVQRILSSYEKALLILKWNASNSKSQTMNQATATLLPESLILVNESHLSENVDGVNNDLQEEVRHDSKKRKIVPKWVDQIRVSSENGLEGPFEDGYNWRKYGQKDILGAKYPRSYYRCTFRNTQGCWATKQVQRSDEDPTLFDITYKGKHTCSQVNNVVPSPKSPEKLEKPSTHRIDNPQRSPSQESLANFRNVMAVHTNKVGNEEMEYPFTFPSTSVGCMKQENHSSFPSALDDSFLSSLYQTHLFSPNIQESNYIPPLSFQMNELDGIYNKPLSESDIGEIISTNTSANSSPIPNFNFSMDPAETEPNFPFNGFFS